MKNYRLNWWTLVLSLALFGQGNWAMAEPGDHGDAAPPEEGRSAPPQPLPPSAEPPPQALPPASAPLGAAPPSESPQVDPKEAAKRQAKKTQDDLKLVLRTIQTLKSDEELQKHFATADHSRKEYDAAVKAALMNHAIEGSTEKTKALFKAANAAFAPISKALNAVLDRVEKMPELGPNAVENALGGFDFVDDNARSLILAEVIEDLKLDDERSKALLRRFSPGRVGVKRIAYEVAEKKTQALIPPGTYLSNFVASQAMPWSEETPFGQAVPAARQAGEKAEEALGAVKAFGSFLFPGAK